MFAQLLSFILFIWDHNEYKIVFLFDNFFIGQDQRLLKTEKKDFYRLLIFVFVPEI